MDDIQNSQNSLLKYNCNICNYNTSHKSHYNSHLLSLKHEKRLKGYKKIQSAENAADLKISNKQYICDVCNKSYLYHSGLWRHKKLCNNQLTLQTIMNEVTQLKSLIQTQNQIIIANNNQTQNDKPQQITNIHGNQNNTYKNTMVFLNTDCKNAINMTDFIENFEIGVEELDFIKNQGYAKTISNLFIKTLNNYSAYERPIHCTDIKRSVIFVKDNDTWFTKEEGKQTITKAIEDVQKKAIQAIPEWENHYTPKMKKDYLDDNYMKVVNVVTRTLDEKDNDKIIKNIASNVKLSS
jgi:hypothetical protein